MYLTAAEIRQISKAILDAGLMTPATRQTLLMGIHRGYVASLPLVGAVNAQITSDISHMNHVDYLVGYEVPLKTWLENAYWTAKSAFMPQQEVLKIFVDKVALASEEKIRTAKGQTFEPIDERIIHKDDLLPFGFLSKATAVGNAIARLIVPRYESGNSVDNGYYGTGWLIGQQYLMTNHHVINARSQGEVDASVNDLHLQAKHTKVQFDYNSANAIGTTVKVAQLEVANKTLDFAILKLAKPITNRKTIALAPNKIASLFDIVDGAKQAVNIIQHPGGNPKSMGMRNNLVHQLTKYDLSYFTDTMGGSSGSPVCNDNWAVVALHKLTRGIKTTNFQGKKTAYENVGTRIDVIIEHLKANHATLWAQIGANLI